MKASNMKSNSDFAAAVDDRYILRVQFIYKLHFGLNFKLVVPKNSKTTSCECDLLLG